jgi:hypothetical protein
MRMLRPHGSAIRIAAIHRYRSRTRKRARTFASAGPRGPLRCESWSMAPGPSKREHCSSADTRLLCGNSENGCSRRSEGSSRRWGVNRSSRSGGWCPSGARRTASHACGSQLAKPNPPQGQKDEARSIRAAAILRVRLPPSRQPPPRLGWPSAPAGHAATNHHRDTANPVASGSGARLGVRGPSRRRRTHRTCRPRSERMLRHGCRWPRLRRRCRCRHEASSAS